jgi:hypothetical protein
MCSTRFAVLCATALLFCSVQGLAVPIEIVNWSFETPVTADDTWGGFPDGWNNAGGTTKVIAPVVNQPNAADGRQVGVLWANSWITQTLNQSWRGNGTYTFTFSVAYASFSPSSPKARVYLRNANTGVNVGSWGADALSYRVWTTRTITITDASAHAGSPIQLVFGNANTATSYMMVDKVSLDGPVPEPAGVFAIATGLIGLAGMRVNRRR